MYTAEESYDVYRERAVRARVEHRCAACREPIAAGATYYRVAMVYDGTADSIARCARCQTIHKHLRAERDERSDQWPDERLNCGDTYAEVFGREPPDEIAALAFALPGDEP